MITSYNKKKNNPLKNHHHSLYHPLKVLGNSSIMECNNFESTIEKWFMNPEEDKSADSNNKK